MQARYERDDVRRRVVITVSGVITAPEVRDMIDTQASNGTWEYAVLYDQREAHVQLSSAEIRSIVAHVGALSRQHGRRGPVVVVVGADVDYGVNRIFEAYAEGEGYHVAVFRTLPEAMAWLDVAPA